MMRTTSQAAQRWSSALNSALAGATSPLKLYLHHTFGKRLGTEWRRSSLPAFFRWWRAGLLDCLPTQWRTVIDRRDSERLFFITVDARSGISTIADLAADHNDRHRTDAAQASGRNVLVLPHDAVLIKSLRLPAAVRDTLHTALSYDIDRQTPFAADQISFDARIIGGESVQANHRDKQIDVELIVLPLVTLQPLLDQFNAVAGRTLHGIDVLDRHDQRLEINLLPAALRATHTGTARRRNGWLAAGTCVLLCIALFQWQNHQNAQLAAMQQHIDGMRAQALAVMHLRNQVRDQVSTASYLSRLKTARPGLDTVMLQLTTALPDDSWLQQLEVDPSGTLTMAGLSGHATAIVGRLKNATALKDVQFQGVIEPDAASHLDHFYLSTKLKGD